MSLCRLLRGGVPTGSLTELCGESTSGKTQLCLQLLLTSQLPASSGGLAGRSLYIHTEGKAALGRLASIAAERFPQLPCACDDVLVANASAGAEQLCDALQQASAAAHGQWVLVAWLADGSRRWKLSAPLRPPACRPCDWWCWTPSRIRFAAWI